MDRTTPSRAKRGSQVLLFNYQELNYPRAARSAAVKSYFIIFRNKITPEPRDARQSSPTFKFSGIKLLQSRVKRGSKVLLFLFRNKNTPEPREAGQ